MGVDLGVKLHSITLCYNMLLILFNNQNHTIGVCFSIVVHPDRGILNCTRVEMEGSGSVGAVALLLGI